MKKRLYFIALFGFLCLLIAIPCTSYATDYESILTDDGYSNDSNTTYWAQVFTAGSSHSMNAVTLKLFRVGATNATARVSVQALDGSVPDGVDLAYGDFDIDAEIVSTCAIPCSTAETYQIPFTSSASLTNATGYAIVVRTLTAPDNGGLYQRLQSRDPATGTAKLTTDSGANWIAINGQDFYFITQDIVLSSQITITAPVTGTTITDDTTLLEGTWANIDHTTWTNIKIAFNDLQIGETSSIVNVPITSDDGNFSIPLSSFNISNNGGWTLRAIVENNYEYNFDVPSPTYALIFNISGLPTPYAFTDFESWYNTNVTDYAEPSAWATALVGFLNPIFEKVGQFSNRIVVYLDVSTAYEKGNYIGNVFPVIGAYVLKIDLFFGGFPIISFFRWGILLMIGLFTVKVILKLLSFIPLVGGGG